VRWDSFRGHVAVESYSTESCVAFGLLGYLTKKLVSGEVNRHDVRLVTAPVGQQEAGAFQQWMSSTHSEMSCGHAEVVAGAQPRLNRAERSQKGGLGVPCTSRDALSTGRSQRGGERKRCYVQKAPKV
jgi:hypothetical protein